MDKNDSRKGFQLIDLEKIRLIKNKQRKHITRLSLETDGLTMLYENDANPGKMFSMKIIGWGLNSVGEVTGLVPWLDTLVSCTDLQDPLNGHWVGYYNPGTYKIFHQPPRHKVAELEEAWRYYHDNRLAERHAVVQEIPDTIGTHAVFADGRKQLKIIEVFSWRLLHDGAVHGMLIDKSLVTRTPVLLGDACLYPAQMTEGFKYFFQYRIANKIKQEDPEALKAIALLMSGKA